MTSLLHRPFSSFFLHLFFLLHLFYFTPFSAFADHTSSTTSIFGTPASAAEYKVAEGNTTEAEALLKWKASLDSQSQSLLSSWVGISPCIKWIGITCDNSESVTNLTLESFGLRGTLYDFNFSSFPNLLILDLRNNSLSGTIPSQIGNLSRIIKLNLCHNELTGSIPSEMNNLTRLTFLGLSKNEFTGPLPQGLCLRGLLENFTAFSNYFSGPILESLKNCTALYRIRLDGNQLTGNISEDFGSYPSLDYVDLSYNNFYGELSSKWGECRNMTSLKISNNNVSGEIPPELGKATRLHLIDLSSNHLQGTIPTELQGLKLLYNLTLSNNHLSGTIPEDIKMLSSLRVLDLASNNLKSIPSEISSLQSLQDLDLSCNFLAQGIPWQLGQLRMLETLDISNNMLSGVIPSSFKDLLRRVKLSQGMNKIKTCSRYWGHDGKKLYENIIEATEEFNSNYCIGEGGYGTVYKAVIPTERVVAVKKLHRSQTDRLSDFKAFEKEVCVLANIRHCNIVKLYGFCSHAKHSFLVYEFVDRGSLRKVLTSEEQAIELDWMKMLNVVKGIVGALSYLHHSCSPPIIHRDITSNNVLLDLEYEAHVSDFGTARLLMPDSSNWTVFAGTFVYSAPGS
uniref:non-specific serine/threonine protein kinase n=1 Tax=Salix viminalis TaxID=40686 RepID=A0A6N2LLK4_SALVM